MIAQRSGMHFHPTLGTLKSNDLKLQPSRFATSDFLNRSLELLQVIGSNKRINALSDHLIEQVSFNHLQPGRIHDQHNSVLINDFDALRLSIDNRLQQLLTFEQRFFGTFPPADVMNDRLQSSVL